MVNIPPIRMMKLGMVYYCLTNIIHIILDHIWLNHRYWTEQSPPEMMSWRASSQQYIHDCQFLWSQYMVCHINPHGDPGSLVFTSLFFNWLNNFNHQHVSTVNRRLTRVWPFRLLRSTEKKNIWGLSQRDTLWLCKNSYWTWPFIVKFPIKHGDFP